MIRETFDETEDKPLDPAMEKVRRKLVRFIAINLGLLVIALMAVTLAVVYKWRVAGTTPAGTVATGTPPRDAPLEATIAVPAGARVVGQGISGDRLVLTLALADGSQSVLVTDLATGAVVGRYAIAAQ